MRSHAWLQVFGFENVSRARLPLDVQHHTEAFLFVGYAREHVDRVRAVIRVRVYYRS